MMCESPTEMSAGTWAQWARAGASVLAACVAVAIAVWGSLRQERIRREEAQKRTVSLHKALLQEIEENRVLLRDSAPGLSYVRLHRSAWEDARSEIWGLPDSVAVSVLEAYQTASELNDVVNTHVATEARFREIHDSQYKKLCLVADQRFTRVDKELTDFLKSAPFG